MRNAVAEIQRYFDDCYAKAGNEEKQKDVEKTRAMAVAYCLHYATDGYETAAIEEQFTLPIIDPDTDQPTGHTYTGIVDVALRKAGLLYFGDHKTASKVDDLYWNELKTNPQLTLYEMAALQMGFKLEGFVWDVILKPTISPKKLTKKAIAELENGEYCGLPFNEPYNGEEKETPKQYGQRVLVEYTDNPERYFHRRIIKRTSQDILEFLEDLVCHTREIDRARQDAGLQRKNRHACKSFGRLCDFHSLCAGEDPTLRGFRGQAATSADGSQKELRAQGTKPFSDSEIRTYMRCRREWKHRYVDRIEPMTPDYAESLAVGSMLHKALEIFLQSRMGEKLEFPNG